MQTREQKSDRKCKIVQKDLENTISLTYLCSRFFPQKCPTAKMRLLGLNAQRTLQKIEILHFFLTPMTDFGIKAPLKVVTKWLLYRGA